MAAWRRLTFFIRLHNQLNSIHSIITYFNEYRCLKNVIPQIDSKNEWLLLSVSFTAKFGLDFLLTPENTFSQRFHLKAIRKNIGSSKKRYQVFSRTISGNFEPLRKIMLFHLIPWYGNFVERNSFRIVSGESPETMRKVCFSTKFTHQEIR